MVAVYEKNGNTQGFQTPEPVAQGELGGDAGVLLIVHVPGEEQEIRALALAQIEEAAKRGERGCAQAFREKEYVPSCRIPRREASARGIPALC